LQPPHFRTGELARPSPRSSGRLSTMIAAGTRGSIRLVRRTVVQTAKPYFGRPSNIAITLASGWLAVWALSKLYSWGVGNATFSGTAEACRRAGGACWSFIAEKATYSIFGLYPYELRWRPTLALVIFAVLVATTLIERFWSARLLIV